jgi:hypothetical protein
VGREVLEVEDGKEMGELKVKSADRMAEGEAQRVQLNLRKEAEKEIILPNEKVMHMCPRNCMFQMLCALIFYHEAWHLV